MVSHFLVKLYLSLIPKEKENNVLKILEKYAEGIIIKSKIDNAGAQEY